ncbi:MAG: hypothetical protein KGK08_01955 [Acidobacteriota bacterium]|nr:hypothetical protein [Acidobacteriota bacterium]
MPSVPARKTPRLAARVLVQAMLATALLATLAPALRAQDPGGSDPADGRMGGIAMGNAQRVSGTVTAIAANQLTVKTERGETVVIVTTPNTRLMKDRQPVQLTAVHVGDGVGAMGVLDESTRTLHALGVFIIDAEQIRQARENLGKTYIVGRVTAIDDVKLTIQRPDGVAQVIQVDEGTSFKRGLRGMGGVGAFGFGGGGGMAGPSGRRPRPEGAQAGPSDGSAGESITLADIKIGDQVAGQGSLKDGVFVPTQLGVMTPRAARRRRESDSAAPATSAPADSSTGQAAPPTSGTSK